ncbi:MAG TPA: hypothetical protein PKC65_15880, partial [Pyrinomonadaceae bacterium]|nr:hypothetical protein [Pyrinomonadaceae bacterium]
MSDTEYERAPKIPRSGEEVWVEVLVVAKTDTAINRRLAVYWVRADNFFMFVILSSIVSGDGEVAGGAPLD